MLTVRRKQDEETPVPEVGDVCEPGAFAPRPRPLRHLEAVASVDTQNRPLIDTSKPAIS